VTGGYRKLYNEVLHNMYSSSRILKFRRIRFAGNIARLWEKRNTYRILEGMPEGKTLRGRLTRR
jgi:hypothetical protein